MWKRRSPPEGDARSTLLQLSHILTNVETVANAASYQTSLALQLSHILTNVETGNRFGLWTLCLALQLSHILTNVETLESQIRRVGQTPASIEPHSYECGNTLREDQATPFAIASIEPHSYECGNQVIATRERLALFASIEPHSYECGNAGRVTLPTGKGVSFN